LEELHREETAFISFLIGQYFPIGRAIHLDEKAEKMHLYACLLFLKALIYHFQFFRLQIPGKIELVTPSMAYMTVVR
jgi:hypothetical protein